MFMFVFLGEMHVYFRLASSLEVRLRSVLGHGLYTEQTTVKRYTIRVENFAKQ